MGEGGTVGQHYDREPSLLSFGSVQLSVYVNVSGFAVQLRDGDFKRFSGAAILWPGRLSIFANPGIVCDSFRTRSHCGDECQQWQCRRNGKSN